MLRLELDKPRTSPDRYSGQAISDLDFFTLSHPLDLPLGKTADHPIPTRKSEDSPRTASTGETSPRKRGPTNMILEAQERSFGRVDPNEEVRTGKAHHSTASHEEYPTDSSFLSVDVTRPVLTR
jgi:hypothetical protein